MVIIVRRERRSRDKEEEEEEEKLGRDVGKCPDSKLYMFDSPWQV